MSYAENEKSFLLSRTCLLVALVVCFAGCASTSTKTTGTRRVNHIVLCWLKESGNLAHRQKIIEASRSLRKIPGVLEVRVGEVIPSDRKIVDDSFDVGITLTFGNTHDMDAYLDHPLHKDALEKVLMPLVKKIVVYDYME